MSAPGRFPDAEQVVIDLLKQFGHACTFLPPKEKFAESLPIIWISRTGGSRDAITDRPIVQVAVFTHARSESWRIADDCREAILAAGGTRVNGVLIDTTREVTAVTALPDIDPQNRMVQATYALSFRRHFT